MIALLNFSLELPKLLIEPLKILLTFVNYEKYFGMFVTFLLELTKVFLN